MDRKYIVASFFEAIDRRDWGQVEALLSDDFSFVEPIHVDLDKATWIKCQKALMEAAPDWKFHLHAIKEERGDLVVTVSVTATHSGELALPIAGLKILQASGKSLHLPLEHARFSFIDDQILKVEMDRSFQRAAYELSELNL